MSRFLEKYQITTWVYGYSPIQGTRSRFFSTGQICSIVFHIFWTSSPGFENKHTFNVDLAFSNNLDVYDYVGKLPAQHFSVWLFSNPGNNIFLLLKFYEARISEWNIYMACFNSFKSKRQGTCFREREHQPKKCRLNDIPVYMTPHPYGLQIISHYFG